MRRIERNPEYRLDLAIRSVIDSGGDPRRHAEDFYTEFVNYLEDEYGFDAVDSVIRGDLHAPSLPANEAIILHSLIMATFGEHGPTPDNWLKAASVGFALPHWPWAQLVLQDLENVELERGVVWQGRGGRESPDRQRYGAVGPGKYRWWQALSEEVGRDTWANDAWSYLFHHTHVPISQYMALAAAKTQITSSPISATTHITALQSEKLTFPKQEGFTEIGVPEYSTLYTVAEGPDGWFFSAWDATTAEANAIDEGPYISEFYANVAAKQYIGEQFDFFLEEALREGTQRQWIELQVIADNLRAETQQAMGWTDDRVEPEPMEVPEGEVFDHRSLRLQDNLPSALRYLEQVDEQGALEVGALMDQGGVEGRDIHLITQGYDDRDPWWETEEPIELLERVLDLVNEADVVVRRPDGALVDPGEGAYFGVHPDYPTSFGWWMEDPDDADWIDPDDTGDLAHA